MPVVEVRGRGVVGKIFGGGGGLVITLQITGCNSSFPIGTGKLSPFGVVEEPPWSDVVLSAVNALLATAILVRDIRYVRAGCGGGGIFWPMGQKSLAGGGEFELYPPLLYAMAVIVIASDGVVATSHTQR